MNSERRLTGIMIQVAMLFAVSMLTAALITFATSRAHSDENVKKRTAEFAAEISSEVGSAIMEYPAYDWLLHYWHTKSDTMDIEYDVSYYGDTETRKKAMLLREHHPELQLKYAETRELAALPEEDQKLYAEVVYSWVTTRINQIKRAFGIDYLFVIAVEDDYQTQSFLLSAADPGAVRGTEYEQVYTLGTTVSVAENKSQQEAMRYARENKGHLADAGNYMDYYGYLCTVDGHPVLIGMTYSLEELRNTINIQTRRDTTYTLLHQISLMLICLALTYIFVIVPLKEVQTSIRLYKNTKDSDLVRASLAKVRTGNEIGDLAQDVSALSVEIDDYVNRIESITAEKERISTELSLAAKIQESMLPSVFPAFTDRKEFDIFASMNPAKEVGGDFYDFFMVDDDHLALLIADVSGKGIPAALFMTISMVLVHSSTLSLKDPAQALEKINREICSNNPEDMFVSIWLGILDIRTGVLTACNAGHEYPMIKQPGGHFEVLKDRHGFVVGGMEESVYKNYEIQLEPGAKIFLYTDGLPEATSMEKELFGMDRTLGALRAGEEKTARELFDVVNEHVDAFVGEAEQFDDLTMLCLEYYGET